jgi:tetratricopeptide (TPR) repeat protein
MRKVVEIEPDTDRHHLALATVCWQLGKEKDAVEVLRTFVSRNPQKETRWIQAADYYVSKKRLADAEDQLKEGIRHNGKSFDLRFALSALYLSSGRPDQGVAILQECLAMQRDAANPNVIHAKNSLAQFYLTRQDIDKASKYADEVIKASPKNVDANYIKGTIHLARKEGLQATSAFRTVINERPEFIPGFIGLAEAHAQNREMRLASDVLQNALKKNPDSRDIVRAMARLSIMQKDFKNAESRYRSILEKNPEDLEVRAEMGDLMMISGDFRKAEDYFAGIRKKSPGNPLGYLKLSELYRTQKKWDRAIKELDHVMHIQPDMWQAANDLSYLLAEYGRGAQDIDRAIVMAEKAHDLSPGSPSILDTLGWAYYRKGEANKAIDWLEKARAGNPGSPDVHYHLGMAYHLAGKNEKAKEHLRIALSSKAGFHNKEEAEKTMAGLH